MKRSRKSSTVSWPNDSSLCQVRLFVNEDCPSQVGNGGVDSYKIRSASSENSHFNELPPGFESPYAQRKKPSLSRVGRVPWNCPPEFGLSCNWNVVAGEESQEAKVQKLREVQVLEAFYPSSAVVPANSFVSLDVEREFYDDSLTPTIPIEEEEETESVPPLPEPEVNSLNSQPSSRNHSLLPSSVPNSGKVNATAQQTESAPGMLSDQNTCLVTAAAIAVLNSKEQGSMVDTDLLVKVLSNPKMVSKLAKDIQKPSITAGEQKVVSKPVTKLPSPSFPNPAISSTPSPPSRNLDNQRRDSQPCSTTPSWPRPATQLPPPSFPNPAISSAPSPPSRNLDNQRRDSQPFSTAPSWPRPATQLPPPSFPNPAISSAPSPPSRNFDKQRQDSQPFLTAPSWPRPTIAAERDSVRVSGAIPTVGNLSSFTNQVQTNLNTALSLESTVAKYVKTNPDPFLGAGYMSNQRNGQTCIKDINYLKNLIREHGTDKVQDTTNGQNVVDYNIMRPREVFPKYQKTCTFFNTPMGCKKGSNCLFHHDMSYQFQTGTNFDAPLLKKMRFGGEIYW